MIGDRHGLTWIGQVIAFLIVAAIVLGLYSAFLAPRIPAAAFVPPVAEDGDTLDVDYIGWFPDTGRVFDTSIESVARDNATFPKAASFSFRPGADGYSPLGFILGSTGPGSPIVAFQNAVRGLSIGQTTRIVLSPADAYGLPDAAKVRVRPLVEEVAATEVMNATEFHGRFGVNAQDGQIVHDGTWGWNVTVDVSGDTVTIRHSPSLNQVVRVAGAWDGRVIAIDDSANEGEGAVRVRHLLTSADIRAFVGTDPEGNFLVTAIDLDAETFTVDYNAEVVGRTLAFEITVTNLRKQG